MGHASYQLAVKLLIRPVTPARAGTDNTMQTSPRQDTTVSQDLGHTPNHQPQHTTNAMTATTHSQSGLLNFLATRLTGSGHFHHAR